MQAGYIRNYGVFITEMRNKIVKSSLLLIVITVITKMLGLIREVVMANYLGTSAVSDAYIIGTTISQIVITGFAGSFLKTYLPIATEERYKSEREYNNYTAQILMVGTSLFLFISCLLFATAKYTTYWLSSGASDDVTSMAVNVCKATAFPSIFLLGIYIFQGYLHTQERFLSNIIYPVVMNLTIIICMILGKGDINYLSLGYNLSIILSMLCLWLYSRHYGFKNVSLKGTRKNKAVKRVILLTLPLFFGGIVSEINEIIDRSFSAFYEEGVLTALRYGKLLEIFIVSAIGIAIGQAVYPKIAQLRQENKYEELSSVVSNILIVFCVICIPLFVGVVITGNDLVNVVLLRGAFDSVSAKNTSITFIIYSISILPVSINEILSRVFFAYNDSKRPVIYSMIAMGFNIILNIVVVFLIKMDFYSLAITTSVSETIMAVLFFIGVTKKLHLPIRIDKKVLTETIVFSILMGGVILMLFRLLPSISFLRVIMAVIVGGIAYLALMGVANRSLVIKILRNKRK